MKKEVLMKLVYATALLLGLIAASILIGYYLEGNKQPKEGNVTLVIDILGSQKTERFKFSTSTPLAILKYNHTVKTVLNNNFIECIDEVCADSNYWWLFKVNDKTTNYGVKGYRLSDKDTISFEFTRKKTGET